jgi:hypothetical protein
MASGRPAKSGAKRKRGSRNEKIREAKLEALVEEATVDAYGDFEQAAAFFTALEEHLVLPFETKVLGAAVKVVRLEMRNDDQIVAVCTRGRERQVVGILDLPPPSPRPTGFVWVDAYRCWCRDR